MLKAKEHGALRQKILKLSTFLIFPLALAIGFYMRLSLSPYLTYYIDHTFWLDWGHRIVETGFSHFYDNSNCDYMPLYPYALWVVEHIHRAFPSIRSEVLFKLPANLSDLGIALVIFVILKQNFSSKASKIVALSYFFNPAILSNSTFWGQVDAVHALPIILCLFFGIQGKIIQSSIFALLAFLVKPNSIVIMPFVCLFLLKYVVRDKDDKTVATVDYNRLLTTLAYILLTTFLIVLFTSLPFIWDEIKAAGVLEVFTTPFTFIKERFFVAYNRYPYSSVNAFNLWAVVEGMWQSDQHALLYIRYRYWGTILFVLFYGTIFFKLLKDLILKGGNIELGTSSYHFKIVYAMALVFLAAFLFATRVHERHLFPVLALFPLIVLYSRIYWVLYGVLSSIYILNLWWVKYGGLWGNPSLTELCPYLAALILIVIFTVMFIDFLKGLFGTQV